MARRLDIGMVAWKDAHKLGKAVAALRENSSTDWRLLIVDNSPEGSETRPLIHKLMADEPRITAKFMYENVGYAGGVNEILQWSTTEYTAYLDHDAYVMTRGWDEKLCSYLDRFHELGLVFPNGAPYPIKRPGYTECLWGVGFCWVTSRMAISEVGLMDTTLGHHEEVDLAQRMRIAGYRCAADETVQVNHDATATNDPASLERISRGVIAWVNKYCARISKSLNYHSPNVLRFEDWSALYLEEYWMSKPELAGLNDNPEIVKIDGRDYDLIRVPRLSGFYRGRII